MPTSSPPTSASRAPSDVDRSGWRLAGAAGLLGIALIGGVLAAGVPAHVWWDARAAASVAVIMTVGTLAAFGLRGLRCFARYLIGRRRDAETTADLTQFAPDRVLLTVAVLGLLAGALTALGNTLALLSHLDDPAQLGGALASLLLGLVYGAVAALICVTLAARVAPRAQPPSRTRSTVLIASITMMVLTAVCVGLALTSVTVVAQ